jgi:hypothetical protein
VARRIQRRRTKGWTMPRDAVYVGRPSFWGNPYRLDTRPAKLPAGMPWDRRAAVDAYALMLASGWRLRRNPGHAIVERAIAELEGKDLVCWCPLGVPCHADVLLWYANPSMMIEQEEGAWRPAAA